MDNFSLQVEQVKLALKDSPPGESQQLLMAPANRKPMTTALKEAANYFEAAVLILIVPGEKEAEIVMIERAGGGGVHSGQVAFPGGRKEEWDNDFYATALREASEETGIDPLQVTAIGALTPIYIPPSNFMVYPFVAVSYRKPVFILNTAEVEKVFTVPVSAFGRDRVMREKFTGSAGIQIDAPYYTFEKYKIWGATAMILSEFAATL